MKANQPMQKKLQQGATLIVALIFLVVLTVAGVTAARFATFEERMASNSQFRNQTFQLAQSEIRAQLLALNTSFVNKEILLTAMSKPTVVHDQAAKDADPTLETLPTTASAKLLLPRKITTDNIIQADKNTIRYVSKGCNSKSNMGSSFGFIECVNFEINATAQLAGGSNSWQSQGLSVETTSAPQ